MKIKQIKLLCAIASFCVCSPSCVNDNKQNEPEVLTELLPLFTAPTVPENGLDEDLNIGGPFGWMAEDKVTNPEWPGEGLNRYPMIYIGEGYNRICIVNEGKVIWKYDTGGGWELDDIWMLKNGDILFTRQTWAGKVTPDKNKCGDTTARKAKKYTPCSPSAMNKPSCLSMPFRPEWSCSTTTPEKFFGKKNWSST